MVVSIQRFNEWLARCGRWTIHVRLGSMQVEETAQETWGEGNEWEPVPLGTGWHAAAAFERDAQGWVKKRIKCARQPWARREGSWRGRKQGKNDSASYNSPPAEQHITFTHVPCSCAPSRKRFHTLPTLTWILQRRQSCRQGGEAGGRCAWPLDRYPNPCAWSSQREGLCKAGQQKCGFRATGYEGKEQTLCRS